MIGRILILVLVLGAIVAFCLWAGVPIWVIVLVPVLFAVWAIVAGAFFAALFGARAAPHDKEADE